MTPLESLPPTAAAPPPPRTPPVGESPLHTLVLTSLDDDQAQEVISIPLEGKSSIADHMVIASGRRR